jgi:DNA-methyltransferase (dcm)
MTIVSLFSGAGGLDLGLIRAGHKVIYANDIDASSVATYRRNIGSHIIQADIKDVDLSTLPDADVIVGGFPCQGFSQANRFRNMGDERNTLYKFFHKAIQVKQPKFFIAENVKGILSLGGGDAIKIITEDFREAGYSLEVRLVNMADYGVPQTRQRVIFVGQRIDLSDHRLFNFPKPTHGRNGQPSPWKSIENAIGHLPDPDSANDLPNHLYSSYKLAFRNFTGHRPTNKGKPSPTILARGNGGGGVCAIPHYNGKRRLTIRESASVQTFPENFVFEGQMNACYRQIGNAVPVLFAEIIGAELSRVENEISTL